MPESVLDFYESLADFYHLIFADWGEAIERQARILDPLLRAQLSRSHLRILDCACGIGTQAIGLASRGHDVVASDLSPAAIARAKREAEQRNLQIRFHLSDMTSLEGVPSAGFDVVAAFDNALPHLTSERLLQAVFAMKSKLRPNGLFIASLRDYDTLIQKRPSLQQPSFYGEVGERRIVHQVWDWVSADRYTVHLYITTEAGSRWECRHFTSEYRCLLRGEITVALEGAGFTEIKWVMPEVSHFYQPIVMARLG